jgi:hypothetical protein
MEMLVKLTTKKNTKMDNESRSLNVSQQNSQHKNQKYLLEKINMRPKKGLGVFISNKHC